MHPQRTPIIAGNWKMHTTLPEARDLARSLHALLQPLSGITVVLCPPFLSLDAVRQEVVDAGLWVGAQNMHPDPQGALTGEVSPIMLKDLCEYVIVGHSERRAHFSESDAFINRKVRAALKHSLTPILCVGETLEQRDGGRLEAVLRRQLRRGLAGVEDVTRVVIAYEPIWAIGTGRAATERDANEAIGYIRRRVARLYGEDAAQRIRTLYGGSVSPDNAGGLLRQPEVDGALVGGASLQAEAFATIVRQAADLHASLSTS